ncbi:thiamine diphosphokinase [Lachnospiraceae bacterium 45-P1]
MKKDRMKRCLIVSGGPLDLEFAASFLKGRSYDVTIAVDAGVGACMSLLLRPELLVGDFDTFGKEQILKYQRETGVSMDIHKAEKDETDTELALRDALLMGCTEADVLGATGGRLDHEISNIHLMAQGKKRGLKVNIFDRKNKISLLDSEFEKRTEFFKDSLYGTYVSFLPLTETVRGITLTGFKYPLFEKDISILENPSLCVSNEVVEERAEITFRQGILICVESRD